MRLLPGLLDRGLFVRRAWLDRGFADSAHVQQTVDASAGAQMPSRGTVGLLTMLAQTPVQPPHFFLRSTPLAL